MLIYAFILTLIVGAVIGIFGTVAVAILWDDHENKKLKAADDFPTYKDIAGPVTPEDLKS